MAKQLTIDNTPFPLLTQIGKSAFVTEHVETRNEVKRAVAVDFFHSYEEVLSYIEKKSANGECVCWIRNTVNDARKTYYDLITRGLSSEKIDLFHSKFAMIDRIRIENAAIANFGKLSGEKERTGRVLIATQVVEQSLDLDFDAMISDLAPVDLLIQRAGRLHRHIRDTRGNITETCTKDERCSPVLVHCPTFTENADATWLTGEFSGTAAVYQNTGVLWRTMKVLNEKKGWTMPEDARSLIEDVYGAAFDAPEGLFDNECKADGMDRSKKSMGDLNALLLEKGYCENAAKVGWDEDTTISTRLTEDSFSIVLGVIENEQIVPYAETEENQWDWSCLSISVKDWKRANYNLSDYEQKLFDQLKMERKQLQFYQLCVVSKKSGSLVLTNEKISDYYDPHLGWGACLKEAD